VRVRVQALGPVQAPVPDSGQAMEPGWALGPEPGSVQERARGQVPAQVPRCR